jgi:hypothetical protein
MDNQKA